MAAGGSMTASDQLFVPFLLRHCEPYLLQVLQETDPVKHYGVPISLARLAAFDHGSLDVFLSSPKTLLPFLDAAVVKAQSALLQQYPDHTTFCLKENAHARVIGFSHFLDKSNPGSSPRIADISAGHIDRLITLRGTVVRTGPVQLLESRRLYECTKCKHRFVVAADLEQGAMVQLPTACPSARGNPCRGTSFRHCEEVSLYTNYQEVQLQEERQCLTVGSSPKTLTVVLQDELADACQVGEVVEVTGIVIKQWKPMYPGIRCHVGLALQSTHLNVIDERRSAVEVTPEAVEEFRIFWDKARNINGKPLSARDAILSGFCPQLCGLFSVKMASMLMLIGGVHAGGGPNKTRGDIHFLLVGDPGTGKSQIQKYVSRLAPRAVLTSGKSSSAAGLTAAAIKDGTHWALEAGALVLADGGVCCIDEFDAVNESDRAALHEAMEQQTCSIAKAGLLSTLHTRTSIFGTCNPRGHKRYNPRRPLSEQLDISGPLLSRFDIVLLLLDNSNPAWDEAVADHILKAHMMSENQHTNGNTPSPLQRYNKGLYNRSDNTSSRIEWINIETLRQYVAWVKSAFTPTLTPEAEEILSRYYQLRRSVAEGHVARTTLRLLESLVRLSQAHARLMARDSVLVQDAVVAVSLVDSSTVDGDGVLGGVCVGSHGDGFHEDPEAAYRTLEAAVLAAVGHTTRLRLC